MPYKNEGMIKNKAFIFISIKKQGGAKKKKQE